MGPKEGGGASSYLIPVPPPLNQKIVSKTDYTLVRLQLLLLLHCLIRCLHPPSLVNREETVNVLLCPNFLVCITSYFPFYSRSYSFDVDDLGLLSGNPWYHYVKLDSVLKTRAIRSLVGLVRLRVEKVPVNKTPKLQELSHVRCTIEESLNTSEYVPLMAARGFYRNNFAF